MRVTAVNAESPGLVGRWMNRLRLNAFSQVGADALLTGHADISGAGRIIVGDRFQMMSHPVQSHMFASRGAVIRMGHDVRVAHGAAISALQAIEVGNDSVFGPFAVIMDTDFHKVGDRSAAGEISPIRIGSGVVVGAHVTILRGSIVGDNVRILSGSMVSGIIPDGVTIGGVPARVVTPGAPAGGGGVDMAGLVQQTLGLAERPQDSDGPDRITAWDSLGALRLLLAIEDVYGISLGEHEMRAGNSIAALSAIVEAKLPSRM